MKKIIVLTGCILAFSFVYGQNLVQVGIQFGLDAPLNKKPLADNFTMSRSFNFEAGACVRVGADFFGQTGVTYYVNKTILSFDTLSSDVELGQINIPFLAGYRHAVGKSTFVRVMAGIQYRGLVRVSENILEVNKNTFRKNNMDVIVGVGIDVSLITLDVSYRKAVKPLVSGSKNYQDVVNISVGFLLYR
ncbi:MAG: porin family protein [Bacteroidales bacterium]|jgi:hypothetical protein|nr:porin family protein [Bacteroidales bacterium]